MNSTNMTAVQVIQLSYLGAEGGHGNQYARFLQQVFWDVTLCHCTVPVVSAVSKKCSIYIFRVKHPP